MISLYLSFGGNELWRLRHWRLGFLALSNASLLFHNRQEFQPPDSIFRSEAGRSEAVGMFRLFTQSPPKKIPNFSPTTFRNSLIIKCKVRRPIKVVFSSFFSVVISFSSYDIVLKKLRLLAKFQEFPRVFQKQDNPWLCQITRIRRYPGNPPYPRLTGFTGLPPPHQNVP